MVSVETRHLYTQKPLFIDENEVNELIRVNEAKRVHTAGNKWNLYYT